MPGKRGLPRAISLLYRSSSSNSERLFLSSCACRRCRTVARRPQGLEPSKAHVSGGERCRLDVSYAPPNPMPSGLLRPIVNSRWAGVLILKEQIENHVLLKKISNLILYCEICMPYSSEM